MGELAPDAMAAPHFDTPLSDPSVAGHCESQKSEPQPPIANLGPVYETAFILTSHKRQRALSNPNAMVGQSRSLVSIGPAESARPFL